MSWTRTSDDLCARNKAATDSTSSLGYLMDPTKYYRCDKSRNPFGLLGGNQVSVTTNNMVNLESDLRGQTRQYSRCPERKYMPQCAPNANNTGLPCSGSSAGLSHLPDAQMIDYRQKPTTPGYNLNYPSCPIRQRQQKWGPQLNPISNQTL
jgi:hypothetical protein